jgi:hypothetical protein
MISIWFDDFWWDLKKKLKFGLIQLEFFIDLFLFLPIKSIK